MNERIAQNLLRAQVTLTVVFFVGLTFSITVWQYSLLGALAITIVRMLMDKTQRDLLHDLRLPALVILPYVIWSIISAIQMNLSTARFAGLKEEWLFLAIPVVWSVAKSTDVLFWRRALMITGVAMMIVTLAMGLSHLVGFNLLRPNDPSFALNGQASGAFGLSLTFAEVYLGLGSVFLIAAIKDLSVGLVKNIYWMSALTAMTAIVMSGSRTATAAVVLISIVVAIRFWKSTRPMTRFAMIVIPMVAVVLSLFASGYFLTRMSEHLARDVGDEYAGSRQFIWKRTYTIIGEYPILGVGPDGFGREYAIHLPTGTLPQHHFDHAHNDLLTMTATRGLVGGGLYVLMWGLILFRGVQLIRREWTTNSLFASLRVGAMVGLLGLLVCGLTEAIFVDEEVRGVIMLLWGILLLPTSVTARTSEAQSGRMSTTA